MPSEALTHLTIQLLLREPFYGHLLSALPKCRGEEEWPLLAVGAHKLLLRVPEKTDVAAPPEVLSLGMLKHEMLHLIFGHPAVPEDIRYPGIYHLATDLVVNQYLSKEEQPADALTISLFDELFLEEGQGWRYYYQRLKATVAEHRQVSELLEDCLCRRHPALRRHRFWEPVSRHFTRTGNKVLDAQMRELKRSSLKSAGEASVGQLPGAVQQALNPSLPEAAGTDWRRVLRLFATSSRRTRLKNTIRRPSKRYGTTPGLKVVRTGSLLVAVDTSASVEQEQLEQFFHEIHRLWRQGYEVMVVECDLSIRRRYPYQGRPPDTVAGRGGTLFDAPIAWANDHFRPDGLIYFTDGEGPAPALSSRCPLLWAIAGEETGTHLPGRRIKLN